MTRWTGWTGHTVLPLAAMLAALGCGSGSGDGDSDSGGETTSSSQDGTSTASDTNSDAATADTGEGSSGESGDDDGPKFDVGLMDLPGNECEGGMGDVQFSYIWIANSSQGTISKVNTQTMAEEGRYIVRPDSNGSPSRTSVNLNGDVAVANRSGGITKVMARAEDCVDDNGMPGIQTSSGKDDLLAWDIEECVAWHTPMNYTTQRPLAWAQGDLDEQTCTYSDAKVWAAAAQSGQSGSVEVLRLDGADGMVEDTIPIPELAVGNFGPYGGAVNAAGDFWFIDSGNDRTEAPLIRVDADDLSYQIWPTPAGMRSYGLALDAKGRPWVAGYSTGVARFDPDTETFAENNDTPGLGMMADAEDRIWVATHPTAGQGTFALDVETLEQVENIDLPTSLSWGISIDFFGMVWVVDRGSNSAYRVDPDDYSYVTYDGLTGPYTYSDMTGWGLNLVTNPPG